MAGAILLVVSGCGGPANTYDSIVTGTITIDGKLAKSGSVAFQPVKKGLAAVGYIKSDGSYSLRTGQGDLTQADGGSIASGEYAVTVSVTAPATDGASLDGGPPKPGPSLVDRKYASKDTTDLRYTVKPGRQTIELKLKGADAEAFAESAASNAPKAEPATDNNTEQAETTEASQQNSEPSAAPPAGEPPKENPTAGPEK